MLASGTVRFSAKSHLEKLNIFAAFDIESKIFVSVALLLAARILEKVCVCINHDWQNV